MDFKSKNPKSHSWPYKSIYAMTETNPYGKQATFRLFDLRAIDGTPFLAVYGDLTIDPSYPELFALDLTDSSDLRKKWENGEISWTDFWSHKGWLAKITYNWVIQSEEDAIKNLDKHPDAELEYIAYDLATDHVKDILKKQKNTSPYILYFNHLESHITFYTICFNNSPTPLYAKILQSKKAEYENFLKKYSHRIDWKKVA
jgi:hypothetical protein